MTYNRRAKVDATAKRSKVFSVPAIASAISESTPWRSISGGCPRKQVAQFNEMYRQNGISGAYHEPDGTLVAHSRGARREVCRVRGIVDNDAGYGDYSGS